MEHWDRTGAARTGWPPATPSADGPPGRLRADLQPLREDDPARLGRYRLAGLLGQGGQARVYLGVGAYAELVAVKALVPSARAGHTARRRLAAEAAAVARVQSPATTRLIEVGVDATVPYLVTTFVDGPTLHEQIARNGPLDRPGLDLLATGLLAALTCIHAAELVHHDVKPGNVLLGTHGPQLVDFGATVCAGAYVPGARSRAGVLTTPAYMAPELLGPGQVTPAADLFSWASTMTFAATGHGPFHAEEQARMLHRLAHDPPDLDGLVDPLLSVLQACLAKDPGRRPTAQTALDQLCGQDATAPAASGRADGPAGGARRPGPERPTPSWEYVTAPLLLPA